MAPRISVVVNTLNEEANLPFALASVRSWVDEIVVVDMHSDDRTTEIAREFGAEVFLHPRTVAVDAARAFAIARATGDWILLLDADELIPAPLSRRLQEIATTDSADVVWLPRLNFLLGESLGHTGWGPDQDRHPRFFQRGWVDASDTIHDFLHPRAGARALQLDVRPDQAIVHFNYLDVEHFLEKLNRYTTVEALQALERGEPTSPGRALMRGGREFVARYVKNRGYRDGWRGFYLSLFMAFYRVATHAKLHQLRSSGDADAVRVAYQLEAERLLREYDQAPTASGNPAGRAVPAGG